MRKLFLFIFLTSSLSLFAQDAYTDYNNYLKNYLSPFPNAIGSSLNNSWNSTAKTHDVLGFDLSIIFPLTYIPEESKNFGDNNNFVFGDQIDPLNGFVYPIPSSGFTNTSNKKGFVHGLLQLGIGLPKNTDLIFKYSPPINNNPYVGSDLTNTKHKNSLYGVGIKHDLLQWIPIADKIPIDLSLMIGYSRAKLLTTQDSPLLNSYNIKYEDQYIINATTINILFSKKIAFFTPMIGFGIDFTSSNYNNNGTNNSYPIYSIAEGQNIDLNQIPEIELNSQTDLKANFGARFNLVFMTINANYSMSRYGYKIATLGLGFSLR